MNIIEELEKEQMAKLSAGKEIPDFEPGDTLIVYVKVFEGDKAEKGDKAGKAGKGDKAADKGGEKFRVQAYEGVCIARSGGGLNENYTVRKISYGEGVERVFPLYSPSVESIKVVRRGKVRRAKLYYLRDRRGKSARIVERQDRREHAPVAPETPEAAE